MSAFGACVRYLQKHACLHVCMECNVVYVCSACMYVCVYVRMYMGMYVCMYVCMYVRMYVCMYVCIVPIISLFLPQKRFFELSGKTTHLSYVNLYTIR